MTTAKQIRDTINLLESKVNFEDIASAIDNVVAEVTGYDADQCRNAPRFGGEGVEGASWQIPDENKELQVEVLKLPNGDFNLTMAHTSPKKNKLVQTDITTGANEVIEAIKNTLYKLF